MSRRLRCRCCYQLDDVSHDSSMVVILHLHLPVGQVVPHIDRLFGNVCSILSLSPNLCCALATMNKACGCPAICFWGSNLSPVLQLQELTSKKEEEDRLKAQQLADRLHRQRESERIRKEREREDRLLARQRDDERQIELQRRLAGLYPEAPSREERLQRRMKSSQAGSSSDSGGLPAEQSQLNSRSSARLAQQAQHAQQQSSPPPLSHHQEEQESHHPHRPQHNRQQQPQAQAQQQQEQEQQQRSARQGLSQQHAQHDNPNSTDQAESGLLTRLRPRSSRRRTWQETFAWSPLEVPVPQRRRTDLDLRPRKNMAGLVAAAQGLSHAYGRNRRGKWVLYDQVSLPSTCCTSNRSSNDCPRGLCMPVLPPE